MRLTSTRVTTSLVASAALAGGLLAIGTGTATAGQPGTRVDRRTSLADHRRQPVDHGHRPHRGRPRRPARLGAHPRAFRLPRACCPGT